VKMEACLPHWWLCTGTVTGGEKSPYLCEKSPYLYPIYCMNLKNVHVVCLTWGSIAHDIHMHMVWCLLMHPVANTA